MTDAQTSRAYWLRAISGVRRRVNAVAWMEWFAPGVFACGTLAGLLFYAMRRVRVDATGWIWLALAVAFAIAAVAAWRIARGAFFSRDDARAFLEYQLRINSGLSAAEAGMAKWPRASAFSLRVLRWKPRIVLGWLAAAVVMFAAGFWLPVPAQNIRVVPVEKPPALAQTEEWLKDLAQINAVDPQSLENMESQARELASKPAETQYSHSSLEAADALREQAAQAMQSLSREFESAESTLSSLASAQNSLSETGESLSEEQLKNAAGQLDKALHGLSEGNLTASQELREALQKLDASALRELTAEEAARLAQQLGEAGRAVRLVMGNENDDDSESMAALLAALDGPGGTPMRMRGTGDVSRGRGDAPLEFDQRESDAGGGNLQTVRNDDYSRAALGDKLGVQVGEHTVDPNAAQGPVSAGAMAGSARGGEAVWVNKLTPAEREALKEFYK
ncbi:hypothetical protein [Ereboglobus luteus]|uniref:Uncharacterized protein n=1 Tax=Ereboglobus luteus TaxID=1796921 RepID=A0A2U8E4X2_9BACT|nr:hypothetical protein [Ereboglobus luteus]AWI09901.1 hypothetical protein CKA38_12155 [Ereboglobus luteus]